MSYVRITKRESQRLFYAGKMIILCPHKLRPGFPWSPECRIDGKRCREEAYGNPTDSELWQQMYNNFLYYNSSREIGYYPAYYVELP